MDIIAIEEKTFEQMMQRLADFSKEVKELYQDGKANTEWLDNQDVCRLLSISKRTLQSYRDNGTMPYSQIGHKCYYKKSDIENLIEKSRIKNGENGNKE